MTVQCNIHCVFVCAWVNNEEREKEHGDDENDDDDGNVAC